MNRVRRLGKGRPYDAVIGLSGGRDSSYMAHLLVRKHGLRCVAAYYRTPFTQDATEANVHRVAESLGLPLVRMPGRRELHIESARKFFLMWSRNPAPQYAALCCAGCKLLHCDVFRIARQHKIRSIVFAGNPSEAVQFLPTFLETDSMKRGHGLAAQLAKHRTIVAKGLEIFFRIPPALMPLAVKASLLYLNPHTQYFRLRYADIHRVDYFFYAPWRESECLETIQTHLGWQAPPSTVETWKADCDFAAVKNYMFLRMHGATYTDALYGNLIRSGQITRDEAIRRIRSGAGLSIECLERSMRTLGLSMDLIDRKLVDSWISL